jgi:hypothetical protein
MSAELHLAQSSDLGLGGMRLWRRAAEGEPALPLATPLRLAFQLPDDGQLLEVAGEVVFDRQTVSSENGAASGSSYRATGVRFSALPAEVLTRLRSFLEE